MLITIAFAIALAGQTSAQPVMETANTARTVPSATQKSEKVICEKQEVTGSRLGRHSICLSEAEWRTARNQMRVDVERAQNVGINGN